MPIIELEKGVWLAAWEGDPGRTLDVKSAKKFKTRKSAEFALMGARNYRPFANAQILPTPDPADGGDWTCQKCGRNNYGSRYECRICETPRPLIIPAPAKKCPRCNGKGYFLIGSDECRCPDCNPGIPRPLKPIFGGSEETMCICVDKDPLACKAKRYGYSPDEFEKIYHHYADCGCVCHKAHLTSAPADKYPECAECEYRPCDDKDPQKSDYCPARR